MDLLLTIPDATNLLSTRVRDARKRRGWTQAELAERAAVSVATIGRLEDAGTGQLVTFLRVLSALGHLRDVEQLLQPAAPRTLEELRRA